MPTVKCRICGGGFYAKPSWLKKGYGKYCSKLCQYKAAKNGKIVKCFICNEPTYKTQKDLRKSKSKKYFCCKSCQTKWRNSIVYIGPNHANWTGGESTYRSVLIRNKIPQICRRCKTRDRRVLVVHHVDRNRKNNTLKNLIWLCHNCHFLTHHYSDERERIMVPIA